MLKIYHNSRCSKSRCALQNLEQSGQPFEIIEYLKTPPTATELVDILQFMGKRPLEIVRKKEPVFLEKFQGKNFTDAEWVRILVENPVLIERPIIVADGQAWVVRTDEILAEITKMEVGIYSDQKF